MVKAFSVPSRGRRGGGALSRVQQRVIDHRGWPRNLGEGSLV